jgi:GMP synthase (glutamine-hydrolysing)
VIIVDFGGQYTHLISRRIKDLGIYHELVPSSDMEEHQFQNLSAIILSGGPRSVGKAGEIEIPQFLTDIIMDPQIPVLGICYGHQLLGHLTGAKLSYAENREYGRHQISLVRATPILEISGKRASFDVWMSHGDQIEEIGPGFEVLATTEGCPVAMMANIRQNMYGMQFHPEVTHSENGVQMLRNFLVDISGIPTGDFDLERYMKHLILELSEHIDGKKVIIGVSGGVDSTVAAHLLHKSIGDRLHAVFVDHGLLRKNEVEEVKQLFVDRLNFENFHSIDARAIFIEKLVGITDPEKKREIIGHTFIEVFENTAQKLSKEHGSFTYLGQGTIYSDRIESGAVGSASEKIKSHHNLTLPDEMSLEIIEPLKELYKDEVRKLGQLLEISDHILNRYPFPGPGLAVRILGEVDKERIRILQEADHIFMKNIYEKDQAHLAWQAFAALLPVKATGVQGDNRAYGYVIALRAVQSNEGMTADFSKFSWEFLGAVSTEIINAIPEVTRVVYDISTKPPATIEFE